MNSIMPDAIKSKQNNPVFERELRRTYDVGRNVVALVLKRGYTGNSLEVIVHYGRPVGHCVSVISFSILWCSVSVDIL